MPSTQLFPEVIDGTTLGAKATSAIYLPIGVEGRKDTAGDAVVGQVYLISKPSDAVTKFGPASSLTSLISFLIDQGAAPLYAVASKDNAAPILTDRQAAWQNLEAIREIRLRLTDSSVQADLVALAASTGYANMMSNKQVAIVGIAAGLTKAGALAVAAALNHNRTVVVGPAVYDKDGVLRSGVYAAAAVAAWVALNPDISDDGDTAILPNLLGIEKDALGNPLYREIVVGGVLQNDYEDLLQGGFSPLMPGRPSGVAISHLRTSWITDTKWDALMTRLIVDQIFVLVREYAEAKKSLRKPNTATNRSLLASGIEELLKEHGDWIEKVVIPGATPTNYGVTVTASADNRQQIIRYQGNVVRGTQTILVQGDLTITV